MRIYQLGYLRYREKVPIGLYLGTLQQTIRLDRSCRTKSAADGGLRMATERVFLQTVFSDPSN